MNKPKKVKLNIDYIESFLYRNHLTKKEFSEKIGHADNWLAAVKTGGKAYEDNRVAESKARLICTVWGLEYDKLVIKDPEPQAEAPAEEQDNLEKAILMIANCMAGVTDNQARMADLLKEINAKVDALYTQLK